MFVILVKGSVFDVEVIARDTRRDGEMESADTFSCRLACVFVRIRSKRLIDLVSVCGPLLFVALKP